MTATENPWQRLFGTDATRRQAAAMRMRILRKRGRPFLLLPGDRKAAAACLELYPAQTLRGRLARAFVRVLLRTGLAAGTKSTMLEGVASDPFIRFLNSICGQSSGLPTLGILAGNPATEGQRFLILLFGKERRPVATVKVGVTEAARTLIDKEKGFLAAAPSQTRGLPKLRSEFVSNWLSAFSLDFFEGHSPRNKEGAGMEALLDSWLNPNETICIAETAAWKTLQSETSEKPWSSVQDLELAMREVCPTIQHGDFVPWNIKISSRGEWRVLDWERGELSGIPAWDWFHYVIQPAILVKRTRPLELIERMEGVLGSAAFKNYAHRARVQGLERALLLAYLLYMVNVIKPSEGSAENKEMLRALGERWKG